METEIDLSKFEGEISSIIKEFLTKNQISSKALKEKTWDKLANDFVAKPTRKLSKGEIDLFLFFIKPD